MLMIQFLPVVVTVLVIAAICGLFWFIYVYLPERKVARQQEALRAEEEFNRLLEQHERLDHELERKKR